MNTFRSLSMTLLVGVLLLGTGCSTKGPMRQSESVEQYYEGQLPVAVKAIVSDWDEVISVPAWSYLGLIWAQRSMLIAALKLLSQSDVRADIIKAKKHEDLVDKNGNVVKVYGTGNYVQFFADKYNPAIADVKQSIVDTVNSVKPITSTIALYQQSGLPVVVWTNNDFESYEAKLNNLNQKYKPQFKATPFTPVAGFVAGENPGYSDDAFSLKGKPEAEYYTKAYAYTKEKLNLGDNDVMVFVDDMAENVDAARKVAKENNLPIIAIQYTTPEQLEHDFAIVTKPIDEQAPAFVEPKELDMYLLNRDTRVVE